MNPVDRYGLSEVFVPQDVLRAELESRAHAASEFQERPQVALTLLRVPQPIEGELLAVRGQTAVLQAGRALQFVDLSVVCAVRIINALKR